MRFSSGLLAVLAAVSPAHGWHSSHIGSPVEASYSSSTGSSAPPSLLFTITNKNLIAALSPASGQLKWRRQLEEGAASTSSYLTCDIKSLYLLSPSSVLSLVPTTGKVNWVLPLSGSATASPTGLCSTDPLHFVITSGASVQKVDVATGEAKWTWTAPEPVLSSTSTSNGDEEVFVVLTRTTYTFVSSSTGLAISSHLLPTNFSPDSYLLVSSPPTLAYLNAGLLYSLPLSPSKSTHSPASIQSQGFTSLHAVSPKSNVFVASREDGTAEVLRPLKTNKGLESVWSLSDATPSGALFAGFTDVEGHAYVAKMSFSQTLSLGNLQIISLKPTSASPLGVLTAHTFPHKPATEGSLKSFILHLTPPSETNFHPTTLTFITTSSGVLKSLTGNKLLWSRDEVGTGVDERIGPLVVEGEVVGVGGFHGGKESFVARVERHGKALEGWIASWFSSKDAEDKHPSLISLSKPLIVFTSESYQTVFAIDSGSGESKWRFVVPGPKIRWEGLEEEEEEEEGRRTVRVWGRKANQELQYFVLDAATGAVLSSHAVPRGKHTFTIQLGKGRGEVDLVDSGSAVYKVPSSDDPVAPFTWIERDGQSKLVGKAVRGHLEMNPEIAWTFSAPSGTKIGPIAGQKLGVVASLGRVLGDRSTLRKYLNPHLLAVVLFTPTSTSLQLLDSSTGQTLQHLGLPEVHSSNDVAVVMKDHWILVSWSSGGGVSTVLSVELFEKAKGGIEAIEKRFLIDGVVKVKAVTRTKLGITGLSVLFTTMNDQIISIPRRFLDPRRPIGKPSKSDAEEGLLAYEAILPIDARWVLSGPQQVLGPTSLATFPGRRESESLVIASGLDTFAAQVSPSRGFDVLSDSFNKLQLLVAVSALFTALVVVRTLVKRRDIRASWYTEK